jgi:uracil-DNA glycosylase
MIIMKRGALRRAQLITLNDNYQKVLKPKFPDANFVPGEGSMCPHVMFIGEAPGEIENRRQRPFVGPAGQRLRSWIEDAALDPDRCYITNLVKYHPDGNRDPSDTERLASQYYIRKEVNILNPHVVVPLGRYAMWAFYHQVSSISMLCGQQQKKGVNEGRYTFVPIIHPSAALRDRSGATDRRCREAMSTVAKHIYGF